MFQLKLETSQKKPLFSRSRHVAVHATLKREESTSGETPKGAAAKVSALIDCLAANHPPAESVFSLIRAYSTAVEQKPKERLRIADLRGRPVEMFNVYDLSMPRQDEQELFFVAGEVLLEGDCASTMRTPFSFQVLTKFHHFQGSKAVWHDVFSRVSGPAQVLLPILHGVRVSRLIGFQIDLVRIGLELYRAQFLGSIFGQTPIVEKRLYLTFTRDEIGINLDEDAAGNPLNIPFAESGLLQALSKTISDSGVYSDLYKQIEQRFADQHHRDTSAYCYY